MQIDLHHTGTYVLCRIAGMSSHYAEIVAYASQQVDDATYGHAIKFKNGWAFHQTQTAHTPESEYNLDISNCLDVWVPFHFLPCDTNINNKNSQITRPNSKVLTALLKNTLDSSNSPLALYRLGITVHCFADTYSHQDFKGFHDSYNKITLMSGEKIKREISLTSLEEKAIDKILFTIGKDLDFLETGHGEALFNPDIPYVKWSYTRRNNKVHKVDNLVERYLPAVEDMYNFLVLYVKNNPYLSSEQSTVKPFNYYHGKFFNMLSFEGNREERHNNWLKHIKDNYFEFKDFGLTDQTLEYHPRKWFNQAVTAEKIPWWNVVKKSQERINNYHEFIPKENFLKSHWVKFMHAAAEHKFIVLHRILAGYEED